MLDGIRGNPIIAGAYTNGSGICPMLAAHRAGGRTSAIAFARAWDRFAFGGAGGRRPRRATARELRVLTAHLEASLLAEEDAGHDLAEAIASHRRLVASRQPSPDRPGDAHRAPELASVPGWSWTRVACSLDEYQRALEQLREQPAPQPQPA
jgi:hypothetical protein